MLMLLLACSGEPDDTSAAHSGTDSAAVQACIDAWSDQLTEPDRDGPDTQIHGTATFDGAQIWVAWSRPNDFNTFDIFLSRLGCDGSVEIDPIAVTEGEDNELDPVLAVSGEHLMIAWIASTQSSNLAIRYRLYDLNGQPATDATTLAAERDGTVVTGNATLPRLAALPEGFVLAGSWGHEDAAGFQAFAVEINPDGSLRGEGQDAELDPDFSQTAVDVTVHEGATILAWQEDSVTSTAPAAWQAALDTPATALGEPGARPALLSTEDGLWSAWDTDTGIVWVRLPSGEDVALDLPGFSHSARMAAWQDGVALVTMSIEDGIYNALNLSTVTVDGTVTTTALQTVAAPSVYGVDLTVVGGQKAVVIWQEGTSPDFRLRAEWLSL